MRRPVSWSSWVPRKSWNQMWGAASGPAPYSAVRPKGITSPSLGSRLIRNTDQGTIRAYVAASAMPPVPAEPPGSTDRTDHRTVSSIAPQPKPGARMPARPSAPRPLRSTNSTSRSSRPGAPIATCTSPGRAVCSPGPSAAASTCIAMHRNSLDASQAAQAMASLWARLARSKGGSQAGPHGSFQGWPWSHSAASAPSRSGRTHQEPCGSCCYAHRVRPRRSRAHDRPRGPALVRVRKPRGLRRARHLGGAAQRPGTSRAAL